LTELARRGGGRGERIRFVCTCHARDLARARVCVCASVAVAHQLQPAPRTSRVSRRPGPVPQNDTRSPEPLSAQPRSGWPPRGRPQQQSSSVGPHGGCCARGEQHQDARPAHPPRHGLSSRQGRRRWAFVQRIRAAWGPTTGRPGALGASAIGSCRCLATALAGALARPQCRPVLPSFAVLVVVPLNISTQPQAMMYMVCDGHSGRARREPRSGRAGVKASRRRVGEGRSRAVEASKLGAARQ
jgi:hypothetical protein